MGRLLRGISKQQGIQECLCYHGSYSAQVFANFDKFVDLVRVCVREASKKLNHLLLQCGMHFMRDEMCEGNKPSPLRPQTHLPPAHNYVSP